MKAEDFAPGPLREIYGILLATEGPFDGTSLLPQATGEVAQALLELLAAEGSALQPPIKLEAFPKCVQRIKAASLKRRSFELEAKRLALEPGEGFAERLADCLREEHSLRRQLDECQGHSGFGGA